MSENNLKKIREEHLLGKTELARRAGISVLTIIRIEDGYSSRPATKRKILSALGIPVEDCKRVFPGTPES